MNITDILGPETELQNLSSSLWLTGRTSEALELAKKALDVRRTVPTCINMAVILDSLARYDDGLVYARMAYECDQTDARAVQGYGEALIRMGRFSEGWPLYCYERRDLKWLRQEIPEWEGQVLSGKRLLLVSYGGAGDNFYFLHAVPTLKKLGAKVFYACYFPLASLARRMGCVSVTSNNDADTVSLAGYDYFVPIYAVGWRLNWSLENPLWSGPYISMPFWNRLRNWPRVGFCFRAGEGTSPRKTRSLSYSQIAKVVRAACFLHYEMEDFTGLSGDWLPTAKRLAKLDLLITVDTGLAHLAGGMGISTWTLLPGGAAWQYPLGFDYHPFYPSMRMFRNGTEGIENSVDQVCEALKGI